jgi:hypothetical protein
MTAADYAPARRVRASAQGFGVGFFDGLNTVVMALMGGRRTLRRRRGTIASDFAQVEKDLTAAKKR